MKNYNIKLDKNKQLSFRFIYNLKLVELEMLKIYIKTYLGDNFS